MRLERLVAALKERYERRVELLVSAYTEANGRRLFEVPLTDEEAWARWQDPALRQEMIEDIRRRATSDKDTAIPDYVLRMAKIDAGCTG